jgi:hypothetical protein
MIERDQADSVLATRMHWQRATDAMFRSAIAEATGRLGGGGDREDHNERNAMTEKKQDHPARPEQPGSGGFEEGHEARPDGEHVGQFSDGNEALPDKERVGQFSDGNEALPDKEREGQFSDSVEAEDR